MNENTRGLNIYGHDYADCAECVRLSRSSLQHEYFHGGTIAHGSNFLFLWHAGVYKSSPFCSSHHLDLDELSCGHRRHQDAELTAKMTTFRSAGRWICLLALTVVMLVSVSQGKTDLEVLRKKSYNKQENCFLVIRKERD